MANAFGSPVDQVISTREELRSIYKEPSEFVSNKVIDHVDELTTRYLSKTSLAILATRRPDGGIDLTPRGDPPGFIHVLDQNTIALPDRPGNNRVDAFENILEDNSVGLLCIIPGHKETLRIGGRAKLILDDRLGKGMSVQNKPAKVIVLIQVDRVLCHCPKAFIRSNAWNPKAWPDLSEVPSLAEMMIAHGKLNVDLEKMEAVVRDDSKTRLY